ncbi:MAG: IclR family transcriptional regulator [Nostocoides sp.]
MANAPAAGHALDVLALLAQHSQPLPAGSIARHLKLPRSSTYHLLGVLADRGFVTHLRGERRYGLGPAAYELGSAYQRQAPLQRVARAAIADLADAAKHHAHFAILHGRDVLYLIEERAPGQPPLVTDVGVRLPAALTASGLAMLATLPPAQVRALFPDREALERRSEHGWPSVAALRSELAATRGRGYAREVDLVTSGFSSVGAAVLDHNGHPAAGIAITYATSVMDLDREAILAALVNETATRLSAQLVGRPRASDR